MAAFSFYNPVFPSSAFGGGLTGDFASAQMAAALSPVQGRVANLSQQVLSPLTNNKILGPFVGQALSQLFGGGGYSSLDFPQIEMRKPQGPLGEARSRADPLWEHNFDVRIVGIGELGSEFIEDIDLPFYHFDRLSHYRGGKNFYFPGDFDLSQFSMRFYEDRRLTVTRYLADWKNKIRNKNNTVNMIHEFSKTVEVDLKDDRRQVVGTAKLTNVWPISITPISFTSASTNRVILTAEFSADDISWEFASTAMTTELPPTTGDFARMDRLSMPVVAGVSAQGNFLSSIGGQITGQAANFKNVVDGQISGARSFLGM